MTNGRSIRLVLFLRALAVSAALGLAMLLLLPPAFGQVASSSLSGIVVDSSGAVVPDAKVELTNEATSAAIQTRSNRAGFFTFVDLLRGSYTVKITATGFATWEQLHIALDTAESRTLPNISVQVATTKQEVTVVAAAVAVAPVDTGENRTTLDTNLVSQTLIVGRDAAELIKIMPGMALNMGLSQVPWNSMTTASNSGPIGNFSANGTQPYGGMQLTVDGGVIVDTGNQGTQTANINQDQTAELSIRSSAFDAEYANGPVVVNATGKGGGSQFHGDAYIYGRNGSLNAEDSLLKAEGGTKPIDRYWYPGGDIGGPVLIPGTSFNKNRDKLFFYAGFEYMNQHPEGTPYELLTVTPGMLAGDFSPTSVGPYANRGPFGVVPCNSGLNTSGNSWFWNNFCGVASTGGMISNGQIPTSLFDPNGLAYAKLFPAPNQVPSAANGYSNYFYLNNPPVNRWEAKGRIDYNLTQSTKAYFSYNRQDEKDLNNFGVWWWPSGTLPYPGGGMPAQEVSNLYSGAVTHIFGPSLVNETTFNYDSFINPVRAGNLSAVNPAKVGITTKAPYSPNIAPQIFNVLSWTGDLPMFWAPAFSSGFDNGAFGALKRTLSLSDNLSWIRGAHTVKLGFYWEHAGNEQTEGTWDINNGFPQGRFEFENYAGFTSGNIMADLLLGHPQGYAQTSQDALHDSWYNEYEFYAQDKWKVTRRLTLSYGVRFDHLGQWYSSGNGPGAYPWSPTAASNGLGVFDPSSCTPTGAAGPQCVGANLPGFAWNARDPNVPISGFISRMLPDPRVGVAYDLFGNGKTVLRGGFGIYRYQLAYNDTFSSSAGPGDPPLGFQFFSATCTMSNLNMVASGCGATPPNGTLASSAPSLSIPTLAMNDNKTPFTENWDFFIDQRAPWNSLVEIGYAGSRSRNELIATSATWPAIGIASVNFTPPGAYFHPDPVTGVTICNPPYYSPAGCTQSTSSLSLSTEDPDFRPYNYGAINVNGHGSYANYNALQISWQKRAGKVTFLANYTWSKTMGIRDGQTDNGNGNGSVVDPFCLACNYGTLAYDHTQIFNAMYIWQLPSPIHGNSPGLRIAKGAVNGWQISGITQYQSGAPIQANTGGNLNTLYGANVGTSQNLGTPVGTLMPILTCDPRSGLKSGQFFNPSCFTPPTGMGVNGPTIWPDITGPGYFTSDLGVYKNFKVTERQTLQLRLEMFNFLNHPLPEFNANGSNSDLKLTFENPSGAPTATNQNALTTGTPLNTVGRRVLELSIKYSF